MRISDWSSDVCSSDLVAEAVLPEADDAVAVGFRGRLQLALHHCILNALHMVAALDDVRHLEDAEGGIDRRHDRRWQRELDLAELQLLQQLGVAAELGGAENLHLRLVAQVCVGAAGEFVGARLEQRAGLAAVAELQAESLRHGGAGGQPRYGYGTHETEYFHLYPPQDASCCCRGSSAGPGRFAIRRDPDRKRVV